MSGRSLATAGSRRVAAISSPSILTFILDLLLSRSLTQRMSRRCAACRSARCIFGRVVAAPGHVLVGADEHETGAVALAEPASGEVHDSQGDAALTGRV
jgi:hypothetical protein